MATVQFREPADARADVETLVLVGRQARLQHEDVRASLPALPAGVWDEMVRRGDPGDQGRVASTYTGLTHPRKLVVCVLPEVCGRHNAPSRAVAAAGLLRGQLNHAGVIFALEDAAHAFPLGLAVARAATDAKTDRTVKVGFASQEGPLPLGAIEHAAAAVVGAADLVDLPPNVLHPTAFVAAAIDIAAELGVSCAVIRGEELDAQGLGGLYNVGKASRHAPALVVLDWEPIGFTKRIAWVGKGICYDTGGLSIKGKFDMPGMKTDMGGAAAVLHAFAAAVRQQPAFALTAVLCIAENSVGSNAMRPDDVIKLYSGKTVEVNNTDAEGRLVLADGLAWVSQHRAPDEVLDLATLTGAQAMATGKRIAAIYVPDEAFEARIIAAGRSSGELAHALPFVPEFWRPEFASTAADMKNSVKDRTNGQAACAAQFLLEHLAGFKGKWAHVDIAAPAVGANGRGTGFGVGLLLALCGLDGS